MSLYKYMEKLIIGRIYCLKSDQTTNIYIGSTTKSLKIRLTHHRCLYKRYKDETNTQYVSSFEILKYDDCYIQLLAEVSCNERTIIYFGRTRNRKKY